MTGQTNVGPTIIKRKKVVSGDGHHGGAWKVAYADFVTAMMAFFMMMWLLNATTDTQRRGLADYFSPTVPISRQSGGGDGVFSGDTRFADMRMAQTGIGATQMQPTEANQARGTLGEVTPTDASLADALRQIEDALAQRSGESAMSDKIYQHIVTRLTDEGLIVELFDLPGRTLFERGSDAPTQLLRDLSAVVQEVSLLVANGIAIEGHVAAQPLVKANRTVWPLSADRADQMRLLLQGDGMEPDRIQRVTGHADREPATADPMAVRNNRIEVIFLR